MNLIIGAGAVGTTLAGYLLAAGQPVRLLIRERDLPTYEQLPDLAVQRSGGRATLTVPRPGLTTTLDLSDVAQAFICVKHTALDALLEQLPATLPEPLTLVSTLNGISAMPRLRQRYPAGKLANMTIMFNAQLRSPLRATLQSHPQVTIDSADASLPALFKGSGMRVQVTSGPAYAWGKLLLNLANAICAVTHTTVKELLSLKDLRIIYAAAMDEATTLLDRSGIAYQFPMPLPYPLYRQILLRGGSLAWWLAHVKNGLEDGSYPSMVTDVENGRLTEIDHINGELETLGRTRNLSAPINAELISLVRSFAGQAPAPYLSAAQLRARLGL